MTEFQKPTFDGRLQYYELLRQILTEGKKMAILGDLAGWYRCLEITFNMVKAYIDPKEQAKIREQLDRARERVSTSYQQKHASQTVKFQNQLRTDRLLLEIDGEIHVAGKRMFLPLETPDEGEFDMQRFMQESDLAR